MVTFWPGESTWTPADTTFWPGCSPLAITASLPSAVAICTGCDRTVMVAVSSTHTAEPLPSWRSALVGSLMTPAVACAGTAGTTYTVAPSGRASRACCAASVTLTA
jgi:hypothetical protein